MRLTLSSLLLGAALLPVPAFAQASAAAPAPAPASAAVKPIAFTQRTLANGLRVYAIRDTGTANVSVQVWYDVGSKDDPKDRSGFAHLFEHLMFKATRNLVPEQIDRLTEDVGGYNNASTNDDYTNYYEVVPANHLQRILFAEADRMASLVVEPTSYASERDVVKEELRQSTLARPYGKLLSLYYPAISYSAHPYARATIGSIENLDAATIDDVRAFHATYYRPDNAILVVSGNFDPAQLDKWVDQYFASIARPNRPIPRVIVQEPARTRATHYTVYEPNTPLPAVLVSWKLPPDNDPDYPALLVLKSILADGESSRFYQSLVYRDQLAQSADAFLDTRKSTGQFVAYSILASGKDAATGEAALRREVARMRTAPVSAAELAEAKNQILTAGIRARETAEGKASTIAASVIVDGDPSTSDRQLAAVSRVTAADVQRVAAKYLNDNQSAAIAYLPVKAKPAGAKGDTIAVAPGVQVAPLAPPADVALVTPAPAAQRLQPPAPAAPIAPTLPRPVVTTLANGLTIVTVEKHDQPLVTANLVSKAGGGSDPAGRAGLHSLAADVLTKGTTTRSASEIAAAVEALGGSLDSDAAWDGSAVNLTVKSDQIRPALTLLADVAQHPVFASDEVERARAQAIDAVAVTLKSPASLSGLVAGRAMFGDAPYGHPLSGTPGSLKAITPAELKAAYARTWTPQNATLLLVGDITPAAAETLAKQSFGAWKAGSAPAAALAEGAAPAPRVIVVDMPDAGQAGVVVGRPALTRRDPVFYSASVANGVLGGGFSSRLNQEIRIKRGLAYGAGSSLSARRLPGSLTARTQTKNPTAAETVSIILAEMARLGREPVAAAELEPRKATLVGDFGREIETTAGIAGVLGEYAVEDVPLSELGAFTTKVNAVTPQDLQAAAARLLDPSKASIVVVGDARQFVEALRRDHPNLELIPASVLNLDRTSLR
ncbi:M16 family metallopeptidase [Sphingomonas aracearum]|uniref:Insulinase family protein n=1 Tax=Sphingomonas aracearum TaxID=2283317 RepID=A0A369W292_9SPHN|nr:pitrilysin family protein [Sphingomonas aracearum]RDE06181.1 insulinase family protein [Sphingomonas aracearum]